MKRLNAVRLLKSSQFNVFYLYKSQFGNYLKMKAVGPTRLAFLADDGLCIRITHYQARIILRRLWMLIACALCYKATWLPYSIHIITAPVSTVIATRVHGLCPSRGHYLCNHTPRWSVEERGRPDKPLIKPIWRGEAAGVIPLT